MPLRFNALVPPFDLVPAPGAWIPLELPPAVETLPGSNEEARVRMEPGDIVRMTGMVRVKPGHSVNEGELLATLPPAVRTEPAKAVRLPVATLSGAINKGLVALQIETANGQITLLNLSLRFRLDEGETAYLECSYPTT